MGAPPPLPRYRVGTASWTDPTLLASGFYPPAVRTAEQRLRFYASRFDTVEVDSTYYALPAARTAALWAERTPDDFRFTVKAFAWLTRHGAETRALPQALRGLLPAAALAQPRVADPPPEALDLAFRLFAAGIAPLRDAGKLGAVLLQFPPWFVPTPGNEAWIDACAARLHGCPLAIEFRHPGWFGTRGARTEAWLRDRGLALVCLDAPRAPAIPETPFVATAGFAYVRLHGRNRAAWFGRHASAAERFRYCYSDEELRACAARVRDIRGVPTVYVIFNNCYADYGVRNAATLRALLEAGPPAAP